MARAGIGVGIVTIVAACVGVGATPTLAQVSAHEAGWLETWNVTPAIRYDTDELLRRSRVASRLQEAEAAARGGDQVAALLVALELNRRCNGGARISRVHCAAYAAWRGAWGDLHRAEVSAELRRFAFIDGRREGWKGRATEVARLFDLGVGGPPDAAAAELFYHMAIDYGEPGADRAEAKYRLGRLWEEGRIGPATLSAERRMEFAQNFYQAAAHEDHPVAAYVIAHVFLARSEDKDQAWRKSWAAGYFQQAADAGVADAAWRYAQLLETGEVAEPDGPAKVLKYYRMAAASGHVPSMAGVARAHANGWGVRANPSAAEEWWKRAADAGHAESAWIVANRFARRDDFSGGLPYLRRAAQGGYPRAQPLLDQWAASGVRERSLGNSLLSVLEFVGDIGAEYERQRQQEIAVQEAQAVDYAAALYATGHYSGNSSGTDGGNSRTGRSSSNSDFDGGSSGSGETRSGRLEGHLTIEESPFNEEWRRQLRDNQAAADRGWAEYRANEDARWARFRAATADARARAANIGSGSCRENCGASRQ